MRRREVLSQKQLAIFALLLVVGVLLTSGLLSVAVVLQAASLRPALPRRKRRRWTAFT
jgi:hypothetical protein